MFSYPLKWIFLIVGLFIFLAGWFYPGLEVDSERALIFTGSVFVLCSLVIEIITSE